MCFTDSFHGLQRKITFTSYLVPDVGARLAKWEDNKSYLSEHLVMEVGAHLKLELLYTNLCMQLVNKEKN